MYQHTHLQIEFEFTCTVDEYRKLANERAPTIAGVRGLLSKLWIVDEERRRAGGAYLFSDRAAANAYLEGPIVAGLRANPAFRQLSVRLFDVITTASEVTRGL
ncbi:MAG TPA: YdhR family protein [Polyangiaceae bacterium]|nr:YdhR family protein [Polyangiaceae bacterium]